jgi:hypothetical protein
MRKSAHRLFIRIPIQTIVIDHVGACPCRKSGATFPGHALKLENDAATPTFQAADSKLEHIAYGNSRLDHDDLERHAGGKAAQRPTFPHPALGHVPEKWLHFSDKDMLQFIEVARILVTRMIPSEWNTR